MIKHRCLNTYCSNSKIYIKSKIQLKGPRAATYLQWGFKLILEVLKLIKLISKVRRLIKIWNSKMFKKALEGNLNLQFHQMPLDKVETPQLVHHMESWTPQIQKFKQMWIWWLWIQWTWVIPKGNLWLSQLIMVKALLIPRRHSITKELQSTTKQQLTPRIWISRDLLMLLIDLAILP